MIGGLFKLTLGFVYMLVATVIHAVILIILAPSRNLRIRSCNYWGWITGRVGLAIAGSSLTVEGAEHLAADRPAIYISNHTSALDIFIGIWQAPVGTVGVAKKEVVYYPLFGQLYWLSGHLRIDRGNHERAIAAMEELVEITRKYRLSIWMWPEGTRSKTGRLLPFKKGLYHLAVATGLPVVPVIVSGAHKSWGKGSIEIVGVPITVTVLPAIATTDWSQREPEAVLEELHTLFRERLPEDQQPLA